MKPVPVLYLDLDGTVRHCNDGIIGFVNRKEDVLVYPEAVEKMREAKKNGWRIVAISNQGGIALGHTTEIAVAEAMLETQRQCEGLFDKMAFCSHHPDAKEREYAKCWCRKPRIGMIVETTRNLNELYPNEYYPPHLALFVGDREEDAECAVGANIKFMDAECWRTGILPF